MAAQMLGAVEKMDNINGGNGLVVVSRLGEGGVNTSGTMKRKKDRP